MKVNVKINPETGQKIHPRLGLFLIQMNEISSRDFSQPPAIIPE